MWACTEILLQQDSAEDRKGSSAPAASPGRVLRRALGRPLRAHCMRQRWHGEQRCPESWCPLPARARSEPRSKAPQVPVSKSATTFLSRPAGQTHHPRRTRTGALRACPPGLECPCWFGFQKIGIPAVTRRGGGRKGHIWLEGSTSASGRGGAVQRPREGTLGLRQARARPSVLVAVNAQVTGPDVRMRRSLRSLDFHLTISAWS